METSLTLYISLTSAFFLEVLLSEEIEVSAVVHSNGFFTHRRGLRLLVSIVIKDADSACTGVYMVGRLSFVGSEDMNSNLRFSCLALTDLVSSNIL